TLREAAHPLPAVGLRYEAVERRRMGRGALRTIHPQIARRLVHLILHEVERCYLDEGVDHARTFRPRLEPVPRMGAPTGIAQRRIGSHLIVFLSSSTRRPRIVCARRGSADVNGDPAPEK